ncbi:MAG: cation transporter [SAR202 cluster bacterium]|nr:cation transporter [SAR202 cluster bacterium]
MQHGHQHHHGPGGHMHGVVDPTIATTSRGIWAIKWSFVALMVTGFLQVTVVVVSGSVALLADTVHNFADAFTAVPLAIAFLFARRLPSKRFTYGYGRVEDLAGMLIVAMIAFSAAVAIYQSIDRLLNPRPLEHVLIVAAAGAVGFVGNELVAAFCIRVGRQINSAALIADGYHARVDGFTSLAVLAGAIAVWLGMPIADPLAGLVIGALIIKVVWESAASVFTRALDGVDPRIVEEIAHVAGHVPQLLGMSDVRARWLGHHLEAELHVTMAPNTNVRDAHAIAVEVQHQLMHAMPFISQVTVHVDPIGQAGIVRHHIGPHEHDGLHLHAH